MVTALTLVIASLASSPAPAEADVGAAKLSYSVPAGWVKLPAFSDVAPPAYAPPIYKGSEVPTGPDGRLSIVRDPESKERERIRSIWGPRDFPIYLLREIGNGPRSDERDITVVWELNYGHDTQFQLSKVGYGVKPKYWWRGARKIVVDGERFVIVVWKELDREIDATDAEKSGELKELYGIVRKFSGKKRD